MSKFLSVRHLSFFRCLSHAHTHTHPTHTLHTHSLGGLLASWEIKADLWVGSQALDSLQLLTQPASNHIITPLTWAVYACHCKEDLSVRASFSLNTENRSPVTHPGYQQILGEGATLIIFSAFLFLNRASTDVCMSYDMCKRMRGMVVMKGFLWKVSKASKINLSK